jgi:hypothetical protein
LRLRPSEQEERNLEQAYVYLALVDVMRGNSRLSNGNVSEAQEAFQSARTAAARPGWARYDGRRVRSVVEQYIAGYWRAAGLLEKNQSHREEYLRYALESDENGLRLWREVASAKKDADADQYVGKAEKDVGLDYVHLKDEENAKRYFDASSRTYLAAKPGIETIRTVAGNYDELAKLEIQYGNRKATRDAYDKEIALLKPLIQNMQANSSDKEHLANAFGVRSWENSLLGDPWAALSDADQGLALDGSAVKLARILPEKRSALKSPRGRRTTSSGLAARGSATSKLASKRAARKRG